jgi:integrase
MSDLIPRYSAYLRAGGYSDRTVESRIAFLIRADTELLPFGLDTANREELADLLGNPHYSDWTRSTYWAHLFGYYSWAVRGNELGFNPMTQLHRPRAGESTPDPVTDAELVLALDRSPAQPWRTAVMLGAYAGLRASEMVRLRREDVTEERIRIIMGKGRRNAYVPTHPTLWAYLRDGLSGQILRTMAGPPISAKGLISGQHRHFRHIGLPEVHLHRFRHHFATSLLRAGVDLRTVQELMRHRSIISTQGYTKVVDEDRSRAIRRLPGLGGNGTC